jgi:hypothetical protein
MIPSIALTAILLTALVDDVESVFISRVTNTAWLDGNGKPVHDPTTRKTIPRIERDANGNVRTLRLNEMQLSADEFAAIGRIKTLRVLVLFRTNASDENLRQLRGLPHLEGLNLSSTEITDAAVDEIIKFKTLRSLCLGNVAVTPKAVARLKEHFRTQEKRGLSLGYYQRK